MTVLLVLTYGFWREAEVAGAALLVLVPVMLFTTPWDNYAARHGIWGFPEGRFWRKIGFLPVEEYLFFIIQSVMAMALTLLWVNLAPERASAIWDDVFRQNRMLFCAGLMVVWLVGGLALGSSMRRRAGGKWHYAWHLLYWFVPLILIQWLLAGDVLVPRWDILLGVTLLLGSYLSWADWMAIKRGIWIFDHRQTTGWAFGGKMPWEEAAFFYLTSLLVSQSLLMLLPEVAR